MKNFDGNLKQLNHMSIEMIKNAERILKISVEVLKGTEFNKKLYGEAKVIEEELNDFQVKIDEKGVEIIARFQPAASDLRKIIGIMHMNVDLERVGDLSIKILKTLKHLFKNKGNLEKEIVPMSEMGEKVINMFIIFLKGYIEQNVENGYLVLGLDDEIDQIKRENIDKIKKKIKSDIEYVDVGLENVLITKSYERIADNITNLAESLIYIHKGEDLRHKVVAEVKKV